VCLSFHGWGGQAQDWILEPLNFAPGLTDLDLPRCPSLCARELCRLCWATNLRRLILQDCDISDSGLKDLRFASSLEVIDLKGCKVTYGAYNDLCAETLLEPVPIPIYKILSNLMY